MCFFILAACTENQPEPEIIIDPSESFVTGSWKLVKSQASFTTEDAQVPDEVVWEETYAFTESGTFSKTVNNGDVRSESTGTYVIEAISEDMQDEYVGVVILTFTGGDRVAYNCSSSDEEKESLHISKEGQLVNISWAPCDGPWLWYEKQ